MRGMVEKETWKSEGKKEERTPSIKEQFNRHGMHDIESGAGGRRKCYSADCDGYLVVSPSENRGGRTGHGEEDESGGNLKVRTAGQ